MSRHPIHRTISTFGLFSVVAALLLSLPVYADGGAAHRTDHTSDPGGIPLGTSGMNIEDGCAAGTLGSLVEVDNGDGTFTQYVLSNNHVLARINQGVPGEGVNHPATLDQNCSIVGVAAQLSDFVPLNLGSNRRPGSPNTVDAAIAVVLGPVVNPEGSVFNPEGSVLDIGSLSGAVIPRAELVPGLAIQKSGRTTGHTRAVVSAVNVEVNVSYSSGKGKPKVARFTDQIRIDGSSFSAAGDSGSIIVEDIEPYPYLPRAVGLLFAGGSNDTIANPIDSVLLALGVAMVAGPPNTEAGSVGGTVTDDGNAPVAGATVSVDGRNLGQTDGSGNYLISGLVTGSRTVSVEASGLGAASAVVVVVANTTVTQDFVLSAPQAASQAIPECITYDPSGGKSGTKNLNITIAVVDDFGAPVVGAVVNISVDLDGSLFGTGSGATTNNSGEARYVVRNAPSGEYETTVTAIVGTNELGDPLAFAGPQTTPPNLYMKATSSAPESFCQASSGGASSTQSAPTPSAASVAKARASKARSSAALFAVPGVVGHGVGVDSSGNAVIEVYLESDDSVARASIPASIDGVAVKVMVTGAYVAF